MCTLLPLTSESQQIERKRHIGNGTLAPFRVVFLLEKNNIHVPPPVIRACTHTHLPSLLAPAPLLFCHTHTDIVTVIFKEGDSVLAPSFLRTHFTHVYIMVQLLTQEQHPHDPGSTYYRCAVYVFPPRFLQIFRVCVLFMSPAFLLYPSIL